MCVVHLLADIDRPQIDLFIVFSSDDVQPVVVAECTPFHVDDHLFGLVVVAVPCADAIELLHVARVGARAQDQADARVRVLVGGGHHRSDGVVDQRNALNVDFLRARRQE